MKRTLAALLALIMIICALLLTSCKKNDGIPDGMQLVRGGEDVGYYFYGPEEWIVANIGDISCTYASKVDMSSMTFTETVMPDGSIKEYFESEKTKFPYEITVVVDGEECLFGNADTTAIKYEYSYVYKDFSYSCMQIFVKNAERFYIFTYTASNSESSGGESYYELYRDKVNDTIDEFKFTEKKESDGKKDYETDSDGYILASDKVLAGYKMYVPATYNVDYSSVMVSVSHPDGSNINMSQATYTGVTNADYWNARKENINAFADKVTDPETGEAVSSLKEIVVAKKIELDGTNYALAYEYTYTFEGVSYHVYQVLIVEARINGYVFTYIATEDNYALHLDEVSKILDKIEY